MKIHFFTSEVLTMFIYGNNVRKAIVFLCSLVIVLLFSVSPASAVPATDLELNGIKLRITTSSDLLSMFGNPKEVQTPDNPESEQINKYCYDGFEVGVDKATDIVLHVTVHSPNYPTSRGVRVGDMFSKAIHTYESCQFKSISQGKKSKIRYERLYSDDVKRRDRLVFIVEYPEVGGFGRYNNARIIGIISSILPYGP